MSKIIKTIMDGGKRAAMYTSMMVCAIALISLYSCSADGEYDEPWIGKEHRTRTGMMGEENEPIYVEVLVADEFDYTHEDSVFSVKLHFSWDEGNEPVRFPAPRVSIVDTTYLQPAHVEYARCSWGSINAESINYWIDYTIGGHGTFIQGNIDNPKYKTKLIVSSRPF